MSFLDHEKYFARGRQHHVHGPSYKLLTV